ncbi:MAG: tetratricopeptide repeat protein, partial [Myxococcota bacterium]
MPSWILRSTAAAIAVFVGVLPGPARAQDDARRVRHQVRQANLYLKMKLPERARELLTATVQSEPGRSDPLAWLALGRAHFAERRLDEAGSAVEQARSIGLPNLKRKRTRWARRFLRRFDQNVGTLVLDGGACEQLRFSARLAAPMPDPTRKALLDSVPGWRTGELRRERGQKFYLPAGRYRFGTLKVKVLASEMARVSADEVGAKCPAPPPVVAQPMVIPPPDGALVTTVAEQTPDDSSWFESNWGWVVVGAV